MYTSLLQTKAQSPFMFSSLPSDRLLLNAVEHADDPTPTLNSLAPEQDPLADNSDENARRADREPRGGIFLTPTDVCAVLAAGLVAPLYLLSLSLPTVGQAPHRRRRRLYSGTHRVRRTTPDDVLLQNFFKSLLNLKDRAVSLEVSLCVGAISTAAASGSGETLVTGLRTSSGSVGAGRVGVWGS